MSIFFSSVSRGRTRLADLHVMVQEGRAGARARPAQPRRSELPGRRALPGRKTLADRRAGGHRARAAWGGRLVAGIDVIRFVVPVPPIYAHPNRKYFGAHRGVMWLNMISDRAVGLAGKVVSGAPRESLHMIDVASSRDQGQRPDVIMRTPGLTRTWCSGLAHLLGMEYRRSSPTCPTKGCGGSTETDYGPLNTAARGRIDIERIRRDWPDILRVVASITPARSARTTSRGCCSVTVTRPRSVRRTKRTGGLQEPAHPRLPRRRALPPRHQSDPRPPRTTPRPRPRDLPRQQRRTLLALPHRHGRPTRRARARPELHRPMEHRLHERRARPLRGRGYCLRDQDIARLSPFRRRHPRLHGDYSFPATGPRWRAQTAARPRQPVDENEDED